MDELIKALPGVLRMVGNSKEVAEAAAIAAWKRAAGDGLRAHAVPLRLEDRNLIVAVPDAVWQKQLGTMSRQLLFRVNSILGQPVVTRIQFLIDTEVSSALPAPKKEKDSAPENEVPLELWSAANAIQDKQLRKAFLRAAVGSLKRRGNRL